MGNDIFGWLCFIIGVALCVAYIVIALRPAPPVTAQLGSITEGGATSSFDLSGLAKALAEKAPLLAAGITLITLAAVVLGFLDIGFSAGAAASPEATSAPTGG